MAWLLVASTVVFYFLGRWINRELIRNKQKAASWITTLGVVIGIGVLFYFKYFGFFTEQFGELLRKMGFYVSWSALNIIMPLGVSFFTFKLISYVIEIHREKVAASTDFIEFAVYISFFPTILSGPIDRANTFIPQLRKSRTFDYDLATDGCRQILWGMFTKMCIADNLAFVTNQIWANPNGYLPSTLIFGALVYPIQLYADFDGYSNMAIGVGKLLGLRVQKNFNHPFLARNTAEYWRCWHISLTTWLSDYVFTPISVKLRDIGNLGLCIAAIINIVLVGLWHGANWTYGLFGLYHGLLFVPLIYSGIFMKRKKLKENKWHLPYFSEFLKMLGTYCLVAFGLVIFRAPSILAFWEYCKHMFSVPTAGFRKMASEIGANFTYTYLFFILIIIFFEWFTRNREYGLQIFAKNKEVAPVLKLTPIRWSLYIVLLVSCSLFVNKGADFIYFQF